MFQILTVALLFVGASYASYGAPPAGPASYPAAAPPSPPSPPAKVPMVIAPIPPLILQTLIPELQKDPAIEGVLTCPNGSQGQLVGLRLRGEAGKCTSAPCDVAIDNLYILEADFFTAAQHPYLDVKLSVVLPGKELPLIAQPVSLPKYAPIQAYSGYTIGFPVKAPEKLAILQLISGGTLNLKLEASEYGITELCGILPVRLYE